jgi:hypothetical protein
VNRPIFGRDKIVKLLASWFRRGEKLGIRTVLTQINGGPGAKFLDPEGRLVNVMSLDIVDVAIQTVRSAVNPDKLAHLGPLSLSGAARGRETGAPAMPTGGHELSQALCVTNRAGLLGPHAVNGQRSEHPAQSRRPLATAPWEGHGSIASQSPQSV